MSDLTSIISQLEHQRAAIDRALIALREIGATASPGAAGLPGTSERPVSPKKRRMSAAARKRIGEATKRRWAEKRAGQAGASSKERGGHSGKRFISAAARRKMSQGQKRRWAAARKEAGASKKAAAAKKAAPAA